MNQQPVTSNQTYPQFYRKAGTCMRVDSPLEAWIITLPPEKKVACRHHAIYPSAERLQEALRTFEPADAGTFKSFLATLYQAVAEERDKMINWKVQGNTLPGKTEPTA